MTSIKLNNIKINPGAPSPKVLSSDYRLFLLFYSDDAGENSLEIPSARDSITDIGVSIVQFSDIKSYKFGSPGDESLPGHPYYKTGIEYYSGQYLEKSKWIEEVKQINSVHPKYKPAKYDGIKHYIFTFHDSTFECLAKDYTVSQRNQSMYDVANEILQEIFIDEI